jgi:hypothetical protein
MNSSNYEGLSYLGVVAVAAVWALVNVLCSSPTATAHEFTTYPEGSEPVTAIDAGEGDFKLYTFKSDHQRCFVARGGMNVAIVCK